MHEEHAYIQHILGKIFETKRHTHKHKRKRNFGLCGIISSPGKKMFRLNRRSQDHFCYS